MQEIMIHGSEYRGLVEKHNVHGPPYGPVSSTVLMEGFPESMLGVDRLPIHCFCSSHFFNLPPLNRSGEQHDEVDAAQLRPSPLGHLLLQGVW